MRRPIRTEKEEENLRRILEEISEVEQREQEFRAAHSNNINLISTTSSRSTTEIVSNGVSKEESINMTDVELRQGTVPLTNGYKESSDTINKNKMIQNNLKNTTLSLNNSTGGKISGAHPTFNLNSKINCRGIMQKFIASRGKISNAPGLGTNKSSDPITLNTSNINEFNKSMVFTPSSIISSPPVIERDADGRPIRKGYVPAIEKIQRELQDLKTRESELKRRRRMNYNMQASQPDLLTTCDEEDSTDNDDDSPISCGILRGSKSIDNLNNSSLCYNGRSMSPLYHQRNEGGKGGLRPVLSLAQLCDLPPEDAPSSIKLIAQWETIIQRNQEVA